MDVKNSLYEISHCKQIHIIVYSLIRYKLKYKIYHAYLVKTCVIKFL